MNLANLRPFIDADEIPSNEGIGNKLKRLDTKRRECIIHVFNLHTGKDRACALSY